MTSLTQSLNRWARRKITRVIQSSRGSNAGPVMPGVPVTWPPVHRQSDLHDLINRLRWFLPDGAGVEVAVPCEGDFPPPIEADSARVISSAHRALRFLLVRDSSEWPRKLSESNLILNWSVLSARNLPLRKHLPKTAIIDPGWYFETEAREWTRVFYLSSGKGTFQSLQRSSELAFRRLQKRATDVMEVNVCGNGPGLKAIYAAPVENTVNLICNAAITSETLTDYLRPAAVAFCDHYYFGPSAFARDFIHAAVRCVRKYDAVVLVPAGYAQWLLATHYPKLQDHLIGLQGIAGPPTLDQPAIPVPDRTVVKSVGNVVTDMSLPVAGALGVRRVRVWGCDGRTFGERNLWSYMPSLDRSPAPAAPTHPAYFRDRLESEATFRSRYTFHCDYMESLIRLIESTGIEVSAASESHIPALRGRYKPELQHV